MSRRHAHGRRLVFVLTAVMAATLAPEAGPVEARDDDIVAIDADHLPEQDGTRNQFDPVRKVTPADITIGTAGGGATPDLGRERVDPPADVKPQQATDVASLRTEFSSVTANTDGTFTATVTGERQHYLDEQGSWQPIDTMLVADAIDGFTHRTKANDRVVRIDTSPTKGVVAVLEAGKHRVALVDPAASDGTLDPATDTVTFGKSDALLLSPTPEGIEFSFRLDSRASARTHDLRLETDGLTAAVGKDGQTIELRDETGAIALLVTAPRTIDAVGAVADPEQTTVRLVDETTIDPGPTPTPTVAPTAIPSPSEQPSMSATPGPSGPQMPVPGDAGEATAEPGARDTDAAVGTFEAPAGATATGTTPPTVDASGSTSPAPSTPPPDPTATPAPSPTPTLVPTSPTPAPVATPAPTPTAQSPPADGAITLRYAIADAWLDDATRVYPVLLDPTVIQGTGSGAYDCDVVGNADAWDDWIGQANDPLCSSYMAIGTDDDATAFAIQRGLFWFKGVSLGSGSYADDGQQITAATFSLYKDEGSARAIQSTLITETGWSSPADWNDQQGQGGDDSIKYLCANGTSKDCDAGGALYTTSATTPSGDGWVDQDVTTLVRRWYTKRSEDWIPSLGLMTRFVTESQAENVFHNGRYPTTSLRPKLTIDYVAPHVAFEFDTTTLGTTFAPSTMVTGSTMTLPVRARNVGSAITFNKWVSGSTDYWFLGYRWFDAKGRLVNIAGFTPSGVVNFDTDVTANTWSTYRPLVVTAPPTAGQYTLRLDLGHDLAGQRMWASDWVKASKFYSRDKTPNTTPADVRWVGSSIVERAEFGMAVVSGQGTAVGESKTIDLADGTTVGINLWSRNLSIEGDAGIGFADLGTTLGVGYHYHSAERDTCDTLVLRACGWGTTYDEGFTKGANGELVYRDADGNRYLVDANGAGQYVSAAPVRIDRPRITLFDENTLAWATGSATQSSTAYSGLNALSLAWNGTASSTDFRAFSLSDYPFVSFATRAPTLGKTGLGFKVHDDADGSDRWFFYANGTTSTWSVSGQTSKWTGNHVITGNFYEYVQLDLLADVRAAFPGISTSLSVTAIDLRGQGTGGSGSVYFDALRFEGRRSVSFDGASIPSGTTCGGTCTSSIVESVTDVNAPQGNDALRVWSPSTPGVATAPTTSSTFQITNHEYATWSWRKQGGTTIAIGFFLRDLRDTSKTGWLYYYAGDEPTTIGTAATRLKISDTIPERWTTITRNLADDARQALGFYDDAPASSPATPGSGPIPDPLERTQYQLIAWDGSHALFDWYSQASIPDPTGDQYTATTGDDYVLTQRGGTTHRFDGLGRLVGLEDIDGNRTTVGWTYDWGTRKSTLATITAPSNGMALTTGSAIRRIDVSTSATTVRFTENLNGTSGRYAEFTRSAATNGDLTTIIPGRWSAACAGSGPSGCRKVGYDASHRPTLLRDPRSTGSDNLSLAVGWSGNDPLTLTKSGGGVLLRVLSYSASGAPSGQRRVRWQDADGTATGANGYARHSDLSPNGSVLTEWAPAACSAAACASGGAPADKEAVFATDGIDQVTTETRYRGAGATLPVTTRRGTLAAARVDNYADPITAGLTAWTQSPDEAAYSTSSDPNASGFLATRFTYTATGDIATTTVRHANQAGADPYRTVQVRYDDEGHPVATDDDRFLSEPGFEGGTTGWTTAGATVDRTTTTHDPATSFASLKLTSGGSATQSVQLLPGQTVRFQAWVKSSSGTLTAALRYWDLGSASWQLLPGGTITSTAGGWTQLAYDITMAVPVGTTDGQLRIGFSTTGTSWIDDVVLATSFQTMSWTALGLPDGERDILDHKTTRLFDAAAAHPAIFATRTITNDVASIGDASTDDVTTTSTYDAWGRALTVTDPDGVTVTSTYAANRTDLASLATGPLPATTYGYDQVGQQTSTATPLGHATTTVYDWFGNATDVTTPDSVVTHQAIDGVGRVTDRYRDWLSPGTTTTGTRNVRTTFTLDAWGRTTSEVDDVGGIASTTTTTYDLQSNPLSTTVYQDGTSTGPRTVTTYFDAAGNAAGSSGPIVPTSGSAAPICPPSGSVRCSRVSVIDQNGRVTKTTDAYGVVTTYLYDFAGRTIREVRNDVASPSDLTTQDLTTVNVYDAAGHLVAVTDPMDRTTTTTYDPLDRPSVVTRSDSSYLETKYTGAGRVAMVTRPTAAGTAWADVVWTASRYDAAGRLVTTLADYDATGSAQHQLESFEDGDQTGWSTADALPFIVGGATLSDFACTCLMHTGGHGANVAVGTTANVGAGWALEGTFAPGHTYRARIWTRLGSGAASVRLFLGQLYSGALYGASSTTAVTGAWQAIDATWTVPAGSGLTGVYLALRTESATAADIRIDDAMVWDQASPARNIPAITAFDADGRVTASVLPGGAAGDDPQVTTTTYDPMARPTQVVVNHIKTASATQSVNLDTSGVDPIWWTP